MISDASFFLSALKLTLAVRPCLTKISIAFFCLSVAGAFGSLFGFLYLKYPFSLIFSAPPDELIYASIKIMEKMKLE